MVKLIDKGHYLLDGRLYKIEELLSIGYSESTLKKSYAGTMSYKIISAHNTIDTIKGQPVRLKFDCMASHDITYVGIVQTAKASGLTQFPIPYVLTNCHNSLCAVGGTINEDDHIFGLSAAKKYGGIFVPPHQAVIHTYMRERMSRVGSMILGSDSHTRYGALGTMAIGEGGPELAKQLLSRTYDINYPEIVAVHLTNKVNHGVGPQDVALSIIGAVFKNGFVKNKVMEFIGDGIFNLPIEYRNGIDVMTTETACLSSIWMTDERVKDYYDTHLRPDDYRLLEPDKLAYYDSVIEVDLSKIEPCIAMPFHPSNVFSLKELIANPYDILDIVEKEGNKLLDNPKIKFSLKDKIVNGKIKVEQGIVAGCAGGTYDNIVVLGNILKQNNIGNNAFSLAVYPSSQPIYMDLLRKGALESIIESGAIVKTAFCGPCFGAGDTPSHNSLSIRHTTRNFESREGSKPGQNQIASVALMDTRSIAATAVNKGYLTSAADIEYSEDIQPFNYDKKIYENRVYNGWSNPELESNLSYGPNIADWPQILPLADNMILEIAAEIKDAVTTTDELIPSGETSSYRSNPLKLAEFTLSRKRPNYVNNSKKIKEAYDIYLKDNKLIDKYADAVKLYGELKGSISIGSCVAAKKPGDGSAREQAASCQRVLGGAANIAEAYATKRYRSNLINWGMIPFLCDYDFNEKDIIIIPDVKIGISSFNKEFKATLIRDNKKTDITLKLDRLTEDEKDIIIDGCLINYYKSGK